METMKKIIFSSLIMVAVLAVNAQDDVYPAKANPGKIFITNGNVHVGNGQVLENATIEISNGKIVQVSQNLPAGQTDAKIIDAKGKQVYPRTHPFSERSRIKRNSRKCPRLQ